IFMMYYNDDVLRAMVGGIGKLVKVDLNASQVIRGQLARVRVEIDLSKSLRITRKTFARLDGKEKS
ncbi:unnamed protein product, partial [Dovyalis caffra]